MTTLGIRYLTGYVTAQDVSAGGPEWPPHPGRVFMALVAAHFSTGEDAEERRALEWLERQPAPAIRASKAAPRSFVETYVPANDQHNGILSRPRQPRSFAKARPEEETVFLSWPSEIPEGLRGALASLCRKVTRIGHSASLVQVWVAEDPAEWNWEPTAGIGHVRLRVAGPGTLRSLEKSFNRKRIEEYEELEKAVAVSSGAARNRMRALLRERFPSGPPACERPQIHNWVGYVTPERGGTPAHKLTGPFDPDFLVLAVVEGNALGLESTLQLTGALRNAAMKAAGENPPEWLTGHTREGAPSQAPHAAFFPLPFVGHRHADGHLLGLGIALPRTLTASAEGISELRERLGPLFFDPESGEPRRIHLWKEGVWDWWLERESRQSPPLTLQQSTWTGPARTWASVTPVVFHHHPKRREGDMERVLRDAFASALLPAPESVAIHPISAHAGAGPARSLPSFDAGGAGLCRYQAHATVVFPEPVEGPVLAGRGRYRGYGLFAPLRVREAQP
jgi:CRISPR-associated protein Csb2